jgi:hypothetical protein
VNIRESITGYCHVIRYQCDLLLSITALFRESKAREDHPTLISVIRLEIHPCICVVSMSTCMILPRLIGVNVFSPDSFKNVICLNL